MAVRWIDGFESYGTQTPDVALSIKYQRVAINSGQSAFTTGRYAGQGIDWAGNTFATPTLATHATWVVGFAFRDRGVIDGLQFPIVSIMDGKATQILLRYTKTGTLGKFSIVSNGVQLANGTAQLVQQTWYYLEFKVTIGTSASTSLKINTVVDMTVSGVSTQVTSNATANGVQFGSSNGAGRISIDDLYIVDGSGGSNNDFLGDMVVETIFPSAAGNNTTWTATPGVANYLNVQEVTSDSDTSYVATSGANNIDTYNFTDLALVTSAVAAVNVNILTRNTDSTNHVLQRACRTASTNYVGSNQTISSTSYQNINDILSNNPATAVPWTVGEVNSAEFGMKFIS